MIDSPMFPSRVAPLLDMAVSLDSPEQNPQLEQVLREMSERQALIIAENAKPLPAEMEELQRVADYLQVALFDTRSIIDALVALLNRVQTIGDVLDRQAKYIKQVRTVMAKEGAKKAKTGGC